MHREYHPADMHRLRAHAFEGEGGGEPGRREDHRGLYALTTILGLLIGGDILFAYLGLESWRAPAGISLVKAAAILGGIRIVYGALEALAQKRIGADLALAQACIAALVIGQPFVAAEVVFIALVGEVLEALTFERTQRAIHRLLDQAPRTARIRRDGREHEIEARYVAEGDTVIVRPGERIPVDGPVLVGRSSVDQAALTGESHPVDKGVGDPAFSGTINQFGVLEIRAEKVGHETTLGQVLRLVAEAQQRKAPIQKTADRLAGYFLPVVESVAALTLIFGYLLRWPDVWMRTVAVLVVACPCALVLATPAAILASMAWLARHGILIKGGEALERLAACDTFAFDKTGTLTLGRPEVTSLVPLDGWTEAEILTLAAIAESSNPHPLAVAIVEEARRRGLKPGTATEVLAQPGAGVSSRCQLDAGGSIAVLVGNQRLLNEHAIEISNEAADALQALDARGDTPLLVAVEGKLAGILGARDRIRPEAQGVVSELKALGFREVAILTGDRAAAAEVVARKTQATSVEAGLLPADKAHWVQERQSAGKRVAMVGDGINDAPALAGAHVGIALGGIGADLAAEAGDFVVLGEPLAWLPELVQLSRSTVAVIRQNILIFAFTLNAVAMGLAALGILGPVPAAILHQAGSLLVLLNAMRLLAFGEWRRLRPFHRINSLLEWMARIDDRLDPTDYLGRLLSHWRGFVALMVAVLIALGLTSGWTAIGPGEVGLVQRQGRYLRALEPGLHLRWPPPFERVVRLRPDRLRSLELGFRSNEGGDSGPVRWESRHDRGAVARAEDESLLLTGDGQLVELAATAQYRLDTSKPESLRSYAFAIAEPDRALRPLGESAIRAVVGRLTLNDLLTTGRQSAEKSAVSLLQERADRYGMGLFIAGVEFQDVHPPLPVVDAYRDVSRAESERAKRDNDGKAYEAKVVAEAQGRADALRNQALAAMSSRVTRADAESSTFLDLLSARSTAPALTDLRLYWERIEESLAGKSKVVTEPDSTGRRIRMIPDLPFEGRALAPEPNPTPDPSARRTP
ncbi:cation-translocating P-type ATPase family protein [Singulisphaera sp. PoT]|uniref:cation-translocating P-type ATPase family protein n=1 Tax=Singulisphaera sp. PoT TaxID=3411797 RepID=UPI003BF54867